MTHPTHRIAIVDDESSVRVALGRLLRLAGYEVHAYGSGEELFESLADRRPDCVVLDVNLPGLSGFDVERRLREMSPRVAIVFITASDEAALGQAAGTASVRLLRKPFSGEELLAAVTQALRARA